METIEKPAWLETLWNTNPNLAERAEKDVVRWQKLETSQDKALNLAGVINWVACSEREPDKEDTYYVYPDKYQYTAKYHKYGKWAGQWTVDDQNGYEYEVHVDYWKVIEPPCL